MTDRAIGVLLLCMFLSGCACVDKAFYYPDRNVYQTPNENGLQYEEVAVESADDTGLSGGFIPSPTAFVDKAFYYPDREVYQTPNENGLQYEEVAFQSADGTRLSGWFIPSTGASVGTVIHFHGNAQNMKAH